MANKYKKGKFASKKAMGGDIHSSSRIMANDNFQSLNPQNLHAEAKNHLMSNGFSPEEADKYLSTPQGQAVVNMFKNNATASNTEIMPEQMSAGGHMANTQVIERKTPKASVGQTALKVAGAVGRGALAVKTGGLSEVGISAANKITEGFTGKSISDNLFGDVEFHDSIGAIDDTVNIASSGINMIKTGGVSELQDPTNIKQNFLNSINSGANFMSNGGKMKKVYSYGGEMLNEFNEGGTHEENPMGGIPQGSEHLVEEGETKFNEDFIFSDRLKINKTLAKEFGISNKFVGKTFAEASKKLEDKERPHDPIAKRGSKKELENLAQAQEAFKAQKMEEANEMYGGGQPQEQMMPQEGLPEMMAFGGGINPETLRNVQRFFDSQTFDPVPKNIDPKSLQMGVPWNEASTKPSERKSIPYHNVHYQNTVIPDFTSDPEHNLMLPEMNLSQEEIEAIDTPENVDFNKKTNKESGNKKPWERMLRYSPLASDVASMAMIQANRAPEIPLSAFSIDPNFTPTENFINREQVQRELTGSAGAARRNISEAAGGDAGAFMSATSAAARGTGAAAGQVDLQRQTADNQERARVQTERGQLEMNLADRNAKMEMNIMDINDKNRAAYLTSMVDQMNNLSQNLHGVGTEEVNKELVKEIFGYDVWGEYKASGSKEDFKKWLQTNKLGQ